MCHSDLIISVCLALVTMYTCIKYDHDSLINHTGGRGNLRINEKIADFYDHNCVQEDCSQTASMMTTTTTMMPTNN